MMLGQCPAYGVVGRRKSVHKVKRVREISPESLFLKSAETEWHLSTLLRTSGFFVRTQAMTAQVFAKLSETLRLKIGAQELDRVCIGQVDLGVIIQSRQPWPPILLLEHRDQSRYLTHCGVGVILHRLPEVLCRVIRRPVELYAFGNRVPVGEHPSCHRG